MGNHLGGSSSSTSRFSRLSACEALVDFLTVVPAVPVSVSRFPGRFHGRLASANPRGPHKARHDLVTSSELSQPFAASRLACCEPTKANACGVSRDRHVGCFRAPSLYGARCGQAQARGRPQGLRPRPVDQAVECPRHRRAVGALQSPHAHRVKSTHPRRDRLAQSRPIHKTPLRRLSGCAEKTFLMPMAVVETRGYRRGHGWTFPCCFFKTRP